LDATDSEETVNGNLSVIVLGALTRAISPPQVFAHPNRPTRQRLHVSSPLTVRVRHIKASEDNSDRPNQKQSIDPEADLPKLIVIAVLARIQAIDGVRDVRG
jgi:hypothetical protein